MLTRDLSLPTALERELYRMNHRCCPVCGDDNIETTCMGFLGLVDRNKAGCGCGWKGIVHDMVPPKPTD